MHFGGAMFFTDYSMSAPELARALEERGFESVWAPEHSHIPLSRKTPFPGGDDPPTQKTAILAMAIVDLRTDNDGKRLGHCRGQVMRLLDAISHLMA
jgi:alkanesulfonate monooxygenase SsuD/methylene tetrahydromethanopterin reductase-like flavin-dependent oxidoreductase (luciferase family)